MKNRVFMAHYWKEITTLLITVAVIFGLFSLVLWSNIPFNCSPEECSSPNLNQDRLDFLLSFAPIASIIIAPAMVFIVHNFQGKNNPLSAFGVVALIWPALSCLLLLPSFLTGASIAPVGIGISVIVLIISLIKRLKSADSSIGWNNFLPLVVNIAWCILAYFSVLRFWEIFGD
jgi:hypothetical protein